MLDKEMRAAERKAFAGGEPCGAETERKRRPKLPSEEGQYAYSTRSRMPGSGTSDMMQHERQEASDGSEKDTDVEGGIIVARQLTQVPPVAQ